jgi:predicted nucleic acid-binding protein
MTVYLDTSSLVKLFCEEAGSHDVRALVASATIATSVVAYPEARAVFARRRREGFLTPRELTAVKRAFEASWPSYASVDVTADIARHAGDLAQRYRLRGFDSIHLACFAWMASEGDRDTVLFSSFDESLNRAADSLRRSVGR